MRGTERIIETEVQYDKYICSFIYLAEFYMKGYYISTTTFIAREIREICHTFKCLKTSPPPKSLNHPYAGYLSVFQIFFCAWGTKKDTQIDVE